MEPAASPADRLELIPEPPTAALADAFVKGRRGEKLGGGADEGGGARLLAVGAGNELVWQASAAGKPPLSERARRLWAQTGDFSKFRADLLRARVERSADSLEAEPEPESAAEPDQVSAEEEAPVHEEAYPVQSPPEPVAGLMTVEEMRGLKERMMTQLTAAQHAAYFSHMLVSLLVLGAKEKEKEAKAGPSGRPPNGPGEPADRSARAVSAAPSATGSASEAPPAAEWGLEPTTLGVSRLQLREDPLDMIPSEEDADADGAEQDANRPPNQVGALVSDYEVARAAARKLAFRRQGMRAAVDIFRHGAGRLAAAVGVIPEPTWVPPDPVDTSADAQLGADVAQEDAHQAAVTRATQRNTLVGQSETLRWETLRRLRQSGSGWSLKPGKPVEDELRRTEGLLLQGLPHYNKHEEARDFWIGYGVPEAIAPYRRNTLAYLSATVESDLDPALLDDTAEVPSAVLARQLVLPRQKPRRLAVSFVLRHPGPPPAEGEDPVPDQVWVLTSEPGPGLPVPLPHSEGVDSVLATAARQAADRELFEEIVRQARALSGTYDLQIHPTSVEMAISNLLSIRWSLVPAAEDITGAGRDSTGEQADQEEEEDPDAGATVQHSALAASVCAMARLALAARYRAVAGGPPSGASPGSVAAVVEPMGGLFLYVHMVLRARVALGEALGRAETGAAWVEPLLAVKDTERWLARWARGDARARTELAGSATVVDARRVPGAVLGLAWPDRVTLSLPRRGVRLERPGVERAAEYAAAEVRWWAEHAE